MTDIQETVAVPQSSAALAAALGKFTQDLIAAKKSGVTGAAWIAAAAVAAVDLEPVIGAISGIGAEVSAEPIGVAEAFTIAGFNVARALTGK